VKELARIVSQLLQLNEIDALPDDRDQCGDLCAVAEAVRCAYARQAERQETPIVLTVPAEPVLARGDPDVIEIAVRNLIENALQHAPPGSEVELRVAPEASIAVADKGAGVPAALSDKIFEPFWSDGPRAGLGLTIVRRVAERYGASVSVVAGPNGGAVFTLHFRAVGGDDRAAERRTLPAAIARRRHASLDGVAD
jgi:signal transduction histidine kinase